jgi:hypothetical protein
MSEDWGPWIEHDGSGCPVPVGTVVHRVFDQVCKLGPAAGRDWDIGPVDEREASSWNWTRARLVGAVRIIRYRVRRPTSEAMTRLKQIARGVRPVEGLEGPVWLPEVAP